MVQAAVLDALTNDKRYAKAIVSLAGIKTTAAEGHELDIAAWWDGDTFSAPIHLAVVVRDIGTIAWTVMQEEPRIFKLTLQRLTEIFKELNIPPSTVFFFSVISHQSKKPHFLQFAFLKGTKLPERLKSEIHLSKNIWDAEELNQAVKDLLNAKRKLKGLGYGDTH